MLGHVEGIGTEAAKAGRGQGAQPLPGEKAGQNQGGLKQGQGPGGSAFCIFVSRRKGVVVRCFREIRGV